MKETQQCWSFFSKTEGEGVQGLEKERFHMTRISLKDAPVMNEEVVLTEERHLIFKCIRRADEG
jgi:hypothetical protein